MRILGLTVCVMLLGGCVSQQVAGPTPEFAPILPEERTEPRVATGSIFIPDQENDWFGEKKAYRVGDLVTVILKTTQLLLQYSHWRKRLETTKTDQIS